MNLVVTCHLRTGLVEHQAAVAHLVRGTSRQRQRTDQPNFVFARRFAHELLNRPLPRLLASFDLVLFVHAHDGKELRQHHQLRALLRRVGDQTARFAQVALDVGAGCHLDGSNLEGVDLCGDTRLGIVDGRHDSITFNNRFIRTLQYLEKLFCGDNSALSGFGLTDLVNLRVCPTAADIVVKRHQLIERIA